MKTNWIKYVCMALICPMLFSCSNDDEPESPAVYLGILEVCMGLTNNAGADLVDKAPKVTKDNCLSHGFQEKDKWSGGLFGDGQEGVYFDSWETYFNGKLLKSSSNDKSFAVSMISYTDNRPKCVFKGLTCIPLCGTYDVEYKLLNNDARNELHVMEHHIVSPYFFGDNDKHILQMSFKIIPFTTKVQYDLLLDGKKITPYYHYTWEMEPVQDVNDLKYHDYDRPIFIINVDEL